MIHGDWRVWFWIRVKEGHFLVKAYYSSLSTTSLNILPAKQLGLQQLWASGLFPFAFFFFFFFLFM